MYLGIEIGGTKLQLGVGTGSQPVFAELVRREIDAARGAAVIRDQIADAVADLKTRYPIERIGFGFGGPVLGAAGRAITSHQVAGWDAFPIVDWARETLGLPAVVGNDCDVAALAEARYGAGRGCRTVLYVTVGTGIGGGLVVNGHIYGTDRPAAVEIGHLRPDLAQPRLTVEAIASGRGIEAAARTWLEASDAKTADAADLLARCGSNPAALTGRAVGDAAIGGNAAAQSVVRRASETLGWAISQAVTLLAPEIVVIGGGVSLLGESLFFEPVREAAQRYGFTPLADTFRIVPAELGETVVVHGGLALAAGK
jgi:glucokinase